MFSVVNKMCVNDFCKSFCCYLHFTQRQLLCFKRSIRSIKPQHHNISKQGSCSDVQEAWTRRSREAFSSNVTECVAVQGSRCLSVCVCYLDMDSHKSCSECSALRRLCLHIEGRGYHISFLTAAAPPHRRLSMA